MRSTLIFAAFLVACNGPSTNDDDDSGVVVDPFEVYINTTATATGDHTCYDPASETWNSQTVDTDKIADYPFGGIVADFETEDAVPDATVDVWLADEFDGAPDATGVSDTNGAVTITLPSCQAMTYRTTTDPVAEETKDTFEAHQIFDVPSSGTIDEDLNSVSTITYRLIPSLLGVSVDDDKGVIAGTAFDCNGEAIEGAQVIVKSASGSIEEGVTVNYFRENFPNRDQLETSADGLWVASNVPEGTLTIELYTYNGTDYDLIGATEVPSLASSINISNIYEGFGDGVRYPDGCLVAAQ
ncbi:MAG: hypothetical protein KC912_24415 [Proteobacteria bacterium]|nr:hypothetical protein [Pseudomonadota bacterium]